MTSLADVTEVYRKWLHLPDPGALYVTLGAVAANRLPGDPVWVLLVGPSGSGKTEVLGGLSRLDDVHPTATLTEASLLSGTPRKEHAAGAKGGLLRQIGDFGIILTKDFTSVLEMNREGRGTVLAALREIYDGSWTRHVGTSGGLTLSWSGKVGFVGGCTPTIDRHHAVVGTMGERMVFYRLPATEDEAQGRRALAHVGHQAHMRAELSEVVAGLFAGITNWGLPPDDLSSAETTYLVDLATLGARCRSPVERDPRTREIELVGGHEAPGRLVGVLRHLLEGLRVVGTEHELAWRLVAEVALGSMQAIRRSVLEVLVTRGEPVKTTDLAAFLGYPTPTVRRALEDLACHGVTLRLAGGDGRADRYEVTAWVLERWPGGTVPESPQARTSLSLSQLVEERVSGTVGHS